MLADAIRLLGLPLLAYAGYTDYRTRLVDSRIWIALAGLGIIALGIETVAGASFPELVAWVATRSFWPIGIAAVLAATGSGLADVKAALTIGLWLPDAPFVDSVFGMFFPAALLYCAALIGVLVALALALWGKRLRTIGVPYVTALAIAVPAVLTLEVLIW